MCIKIYNKIYNFAFHLDMMFGAVISELIKKLLMPVLGFVIDKNMPASMQTAQQPQVPYSTQLEQLQNAYANLQTTAQQTSTQSPLANQQQQTQQQQITNYVNHPSYSTGYQTASQTTGSAQSTPYVYYGQAQLANYLSSQPQLSKSSSQQEEQNQQTSTGTNQQTATTTTKTNQLATQQLAQQLNQLINQYANSINQQANQQNNQQNTHQSTQPTLNDQNSLIYEQLQGLLQEQMKLKNQLEQLNKPHNYFAKEMDLDPETKEEEQSEGELKNAPLNQVEQELERAQRWNTVLKNMDQFYTNDTLSSIK